MKRIPEPELMNGPEQARACAEADFNEPNRHFVRLFQESLFNSLLAAYRPTEVAAQLAGAGLTRLRVEEVSDRHLVVTGILP